MPLPKGWHYEPGRHMAYGPGGQRLTRQAAENMQAQQYGFPNVRALSRATKSSDYQSFMGSKRGADAWKEAKAAGTRKADFNAASAKYWQDPNVSRTDMSPDGPLANYLDAIGRREKTDIPVGETPTVV